MKNFIFKSNDSDLQKMFQQIVTIQKNVLYVTHVVDRIAIKVNELCINRDLQTQVDQYFDKDTEDIPDSKSELD